MMALLARFKGHLVAIAVTLMALATAYLKGASSARDKAKVRELEKELKQREQEQAIVEQAKESRREVETEIASSKPGDSAEWLRKHFGRK
ncbi:hypothetical protein JT27_18390 [Alcaligenes faecalis]|uniref:hypothetical protein n=1 Tax=Alcaligenes faecalis TaxID=511 RepID=UPI00052B8600|nr:hypothetical protein [Alcaligenes faecalis]KGP00299.1 hypothetical protein JT27_18390 [Alcaligenes faecalis]